LQAHTLEKMGVVWAPKPDLQWRGVLLACRQSGLHPDGFVDIGLVQRSELRVSSLLVYVARSLSFVSRSRRSSGDGRRR
jgi:hypothetical protein